MRNILPGPHSFLRTALVFCGIGILLYLLAYAGSEFLLYRTGKTNPFFKIETMETDQVDWVILGASHAMVLDFSDFESTMEAQTGLSILNLAAPGTGPLYNRFVLEQFLSTHTTKHVLYVVDSFAFRSSDWNEDRFLDAKLLRRTPLNVNLARRLADYVLHEGVDPRALADYVTGFSKLNNGERFAQDTWEGETQFERRFRPSASADQSRITYLYPDASDPAQLQRYLSAFSELLDRTRSAGASVSVIKMPIPSRFHALLPEETSFDEAMSKTLATRGLTLNDYSLLLDETRFFFDSDHLSRLGADAFFQQYLKPLFTEDDQRAAHK